MLATLNVHEAMGQKVDREAVATLVLPQLWTMTMGPCQFSSHIVRIPLTSCAVLNVDQFARFMRFVSYIQFCTVNNDIVTFPQRDQDPWGANRA